MDRFSWGRVIQCFSYDFDGQTCEIVKYHPWKVDGCRVLTGKPDLDQIHFHCEEMHSSYLSMQKAILAWITYKRLGHNNDALVEGIARALEIK